MTDRPDLDAIEALFPAAAYAEATLDTFGWDGLASGERLTVSVRPLLAYARALEQERDYLQERVNDLGEQYAALEQERDAAQARHDAEIAGIVAMLRERERHIREDEAAYYRSEGHESAAADAEERAEEVERCADSIATTHAAALARHARRALAPHPEPTPGPRVGDVVTAENVGALPVGTVVRWEHLGEEWRAERVAANLWCAGGIEHDDEEIADEGGPVTTIASLPRVGGGGS